MSSFLPAELDFEIEQPIQTDLCNTDGVFIRQIRIARAGTYVPQHVHAYDHVTLLGLGGLRIWVDDALIGDFVAPLPIRIRAGSAHTFMTLSANVVLYCVHSTHRTGGVEVLSRPELPGHPG